MSRNAGRHDGDVTTLVRAAREARRRAQARYSGFRVGAALETMDGHIIAGCNVENASYGLSMCAERVALFAAIAAGHRRFRRLAIVAPSEALPQTGEHVGSQSPVRPVR
jgi:cytidine deaminase